MANDTKSSRKVKDDENSNSKGVAGKPSTSSGAETPNTSGLRRSVRETPLKKSTSPSPPSTRKSERLEKRTPTPSVNRNSERVEKHSTPSPLRRSERGKQQSSSSSSGSKKSNKSSSLSVTKKKLKKERSVKQLTHETIEVSKSKGQVNKVVQVGKKRLDARAYRALFKPQQNKVNVAGDCKELKKEDKLSHDHSSNHQAVAYKNVDSRNKCSQMKVQKLKEVFGGRDFERTLEESNCSVSKPANEILENNIGLEPFHLSQNQRLEGEAHQSEVGDAMEESKGDDCAQYSCHKTMSRRLDDVAEKANKELQPESVNHMLNNEPAGSEVGLESGYKDTPLKGKRNTVNLDSHNAAVASSKDICTSVADTVISSPDGNDLAETCATCFKRQRVSHDSKQQDLCSCNANLDQDTRGISFAEDRRGIGLGVTTGHAEQCVTDLKYKESAVDFQPDGNQNACLICKLGGTILCCEGRGCKRSYHLSCLNPPLKAVPLEVWYCLACVRKKIKSGVHSVSEGVESIWDYKEVEESDGNGLPKKQFFVKYKGIAHVHNRWVPECQLLLEAPSLVSKFIRKKQVTKWKQEWTEPRRLLQKRSVVSSRQHDETYKGHANDISDCHNEWLVKWRGLDYEFATWELEDASFMSLPKIQSLMRDYEKLHEKAKRRRLSGIDKKLEIKKGSSIKSLQLSAGDLTGFDNNHLDIVNNLREHCNKWQNGVIIDDQFLCLQDRIMKVVSFISSFSSNIFWPFMIITTSTALHLWDEEFFRLAPSVDSVVYHGNKDVRRSIRAVEFYEEGGGIMFEVLITSPEVIAEDLNVLKLIKWGAIVVDECQRSRIFSHFEQIKSLSADMRLLLVNGQLKDSVIEHLLSLLDCQSDANCSEGLVTNSNLKVGNLKERLSKYIVNVSKSDSLRFVEYWVPVQISNVQLEQYCDALISKKLSLFSSSKNDPVGSLRDILISTRKCCDHPYIMDPPLQTSLTKDGTVSDILDVGIKASGKLQLLDAMLFEIRNRSLKVLILFQSSGGSGKDNIGDILEDFVRQRFGQDCYERVDGLVSPTRKQAALNNFNNQKGRFVFLLENRACFPSIKLSSVDTVIIFGSDWSPPNDLRNLQRITLDTQFEQLKIFRLYSCFTVEENVLILAKEDKTLDSNLQGISRATSQNLLMWGVSHLFSKLDEFHSGCSTPVISGSPLFEQLLIKDIIQEFLTILSQNAKEKNTSNSSMVLKVKQNQGRYSTDFPLPGEQKIQSRDEELPHIFWKKLFEGKQPQWKYISSSSQRNRKRSQNVDDLSRKPEGEVNEVVKKRKKVANIDVDPSSLKPSVFEGILGAPSQNMRQLLSGSTVRLNKSHANHSSTAPSLANNLSEVSAVNLAKLDERIISNDSQKSLQKNLHLLLKPEIAKLCEILQLPEDVKAMVHSFLEYVINNHHVSREPETILQAFQISLCWTAASMLRHKLDHKGSLVLAKQHLNFSCKKEEADYVYSMLRCLKKMFLYHKGNFTLDCSAKTSESLTNLLNKDCSHAMSSQPTPSTLQKMKVGFGDLLHSQEFFDDQVLSQLGLALQDFSRSIKDIEKKCDKQLMKLLMKQKEEMEELDRKYKEEKAQLENSKKADAAVIRFLNISSTRTDQLKLLDIEYEKKFEELECETEKCRKNLEKIQVAAREKMDERKACWVDGVKSWAKVELIDKPPLNETGHNQENDVSLNSHLKEQNPEGNQSMQDGVVLLEVPETVSSSDEEDIRSGELYRNEQIPCTVNSDMLDGEAPLRASRAICMRDGSENVERVNLSSCGEQMLASNGAKLNLSSRKLPVEVLENVSSTGSLENMGVPEIACNVTIDDGNSIIREKVEVHAVPSDMTAVSQQNRKVSSGVPENASNKLVGDKTGKQQDGKVVMGKTTCNQNSDFSDKVAGVSQQDGEAPSVVPETSLGEAVEAGETGKQQDGKVLANETVDNQDSQSLDETAGANRQDLELPSGVIENATGEAVEGASTGRGNNGVCFMASSSSTRVDLEDGMISSQLLENVPKVVEGGSSGREVVGVVPVINEDHHPQEPHLVNSLPIQPEPALAQDVPVPLNQALQEESSIPTVSTGLQDGVASTSGSHNSLQQVETSVPNPDDVVSNQTNGDTPIVENLQEMLLSPSRDSAFSLDAMDFPSVSGIEHQPGSEPHITGNITDSSTQIVVDQVERSNEAVLEPLTHLAQHLSSEIPLGGSGMHVSDTRIAPISSGVNNRTAQTIPPVRVPPLPLYHDPLQKELERICKETDLIINAHKDTKLRLKSDCEKEIEEVIAQIHRKYEIKLQEIESEFFLKKKELDTIHNKVLMNKILAEAFRSKCMDNRSPIAAGMQRDVASSFMQQLLQLSSQQTAQRNASFTGLSSAVPPTGGPQIAASSSHSASPSLQVVDHSSALFTGALTRTPLISSISPATGNLQIGSEIRAPAPHLQPFRSSASTVATSRPSLSVGMPSQLMPNHPPTASAVPSQLPLQPQPSAQQSHHPIFTERPETAGTLPALSSSSLSVLELLMDVDNQTSTNSPYALHPLTNLGSSSDTLVPPELRVPNNTSTNVTCPTTEVVCLSDDD
ncbi:helicase protein MOM1 isoform X3 [Hevea brasiliensis]|uniref:helicase protein MOM1 isoform X3 n=1 Tax=Hevea brasiliensis TaxID=3981 RepID=UPI0025FB9DAC|nr:helicase protein MOM1 isoform X3 [Hevea brasiliensis]